jgi:hypothetical protein
MQQCEVYQHPSAHTTRHNSVYKTWRIPTIANSNPETRRSWKLYSTPYLSAVIHEWELSITHLLLCIDDSLEVVGLADQLYVGR